MVEEKGTRQTRGERLRKLRKAKGLSLEEVHQATKIHIRVLRALEEDALVEIKPAYVKGLLKIYCNFLGVDPKDFIEESIKETEDEPPKKEELVTSQIQKPPALAKPHVGLAMIKKQIKIKPMIIAVCLLALAIVAFKFGKKLSIHRVSQLEKSNSDKVTAKPEAPSSLSATAVSKPSLGIRAKEDCWIEVKTDGKTIFKGVLKKGHYEYWEAGDDIEFSLSNAGGVDVEVNGRLLSALGRRRQVIKYITITKEGLTVPK